MPGGLPNPDMDFTPFDTLPAASLDQMVENIEALSDGSGIIEEAITGDKLDNNSIVVKSATPGGNTDTTGSWADWGGATTITVPAWANKAVVFASVQGYFAVTNATTANCRVVVGSDTGASSGVIGADTANGADRRSTVWMDVITLTGSGSVTLKNQAIEQSGLGALRLDVNSRFDWLFIFMRT